MNLITEHRYEAARWDGTEGWWGMETLTTADVVKEHNATIIKLQGDHDEEVEHLRHQIADLKRDLNYARDAVGTLQQLSAAMKHDLNHANAIIHARATVGTIKKEK